MKYKYLYSLYMGFIVICSQHYAKFGGSWYGGVYPPFYVATLNAGEGITKYDYIGSNKSHTWYHFYSSSGTKYPALYVGSGGYSTTAGAVVTVR